jgi:multiple sugar transport system ATP-binding protein
MASVSLRGIRKEFAGTAVLHGIDIEIADTEFLVLVGPSGCGKSTLLRMIAGLEEVSAGTIAIGDKVVNELEPKDRDIAMVFQDYALYPHMSVYDNMAFGLLYRSTPKAEIRARVAEAARVLNITDLLERRPRQLSGGQRQRVAMGRAIVRQPKVFLFDEPLSNLDAKLRVQMRTEIKKLHQNVATTMIYVTHDQVEAMTLADRIAVMRGGRLEQIGTPEEIYENPASVFVAGFIGAPTMNFLRARLEDGAIRIGPQLVLALPQGRAPRYASWYGRDVLLGLRPEHFEWAPGEGIEATVRVVEPLGADTLVFALLAGHEIVCRVPPRAVRAPGERIRLRPVTEAVHLFDPSTERAI